MSLAVGVCLLLGGCSGGVLDPKGQIGADERSIILFATAIMLIVVLPVICMAVAFAWRYRASNRDATYTPEWAQSTRVEAVVWLVPCAIIAALATLTWISAHRLDPYRPIASAAEPVTIDVVALNWKWLFIYPELNIATINEIAFPVDTPVDFRITSGSVMNSFFIPELGSQVYAMAGMETRLSLVAGEAGSYEGISANYSGAGFSDMKFRARAMSPTDFDRWVEDARRSKRPLEVEAYRALEQPSRSAAATYYSSADPHLFQAILHGCLAAADPCQSSEMKR
ncbi:ubiquinol oxidase subunit II [Chelativorans salis]|uniref:Ubiquinol oxidase subunit 2 n=1 Tax=Chelativorans salis TaxID=2978478 RepID=A0ABT2LWV8_9HYPH|nr:ubiquinol oxidase subunit II [Chelativorans sp. EGI FJ00035]MCT7377868.1 ubiquinol oxidase subunit II [Chelativorans sp. EGI FJ00035]